MPKLLGYRKFASKKDGKNYCVATVVSDITPRDKENGFVGQKTEELFMPEDLVDYLKPEHIGKDVYVDYNISNGRAFITNVTVK